jgi:hypothetical protein
MENNGSIANGKNVTSIRYRIFKFLQVVSTLVYSTQTIGWRCEDSVTSVRILTIVTINLKRGPEQGSEIINVDSGRSQLAG